MKQRKSDIRHFRDLDVYRRAFDAAMKIFELTKTFPSDERFSMVDQMRRASRSVFSNIAEGWRKRRYISVFRNKMTDAMQEASETQCWLEFACACRYIAVIQSRQRYYVGAIADTLSKYISLFAVVAWFYAVGPSVEAVVVIMAGMLFLSRLTQAALPKEN